MCQYEFLAQNKQENQYEYTERENQRKTYETLVQT